MIERLLYVGITHEIAPLAIRESIRPDAERRRTMLDRLASVASGRIVLATCERFELYATTNCVEPSAWSRLLARWFHLPVALMGRHLRTLRGGDAAKHLLRVAAGLESRIVGEPQILGQTREAFLLAGDAGALDAELHALGRAAIRAGKRVRHETGLNAEARSIATIAVDAVEQRVDSPREGSMLVVGTGSLGQVVAMELRRRRFGALSIVGRTEERAAALAMKVGARRFRLDELPRALVDADAVIACTSAPSFVIDAAAIGRDRTRPLLILDLSVPRNVDPNAARLSAVRLLDLDALVSSRSIERDGVAAASSIVEDELARFLRWRRERSAAAAIARVVQSGDASGRALHERIVRLKAESAA